MTINHLIVGSGDIVASIQFYCDFLEFRKLFDDPGAKGGQVLEHDGCELLLIPFPKERLPNPAHFAFEVDHIDKFNALLTRARQLGLAPRTEPPKDSAPGAGEFSRGSSRYRNFYVFDPSGSNVEVMVKI